MESKLQDNIYNLEEEDKEIDDTPLNYAAYNPEDDCEEDKEDEKSPSKLHSASGILFRIMFNPVEGWKLLRRDKISVENLLSGCFFPLLALLAISKFAGFFYSVNLTLTDIITEGVVAFVSYYFGFYCILMALSWILPQDMTEKFEDKFGKEYIIMALSTLVLFAIVRDLLPMIWPILIFLPIWTLYIMFKGIRFFHFQENQDIKFFILSATAVIFIPMLIEKALNSVLPY